MLSLKERGSLFNQVLNLMTELGNLIKTFKVTLSQTNHENFFKETSLV